MEDKKDQTHKISKQVLSTEFLNAFNEIVKKVTEELDGLTKVITNIKFPKLDLPKFNLPEIDYEKIRKIVDYNSKSGWTLTGEMGLVDYLNEGLLTKSHEEVDKYFLSYYKFIEEEYKINHYSETKTAILKTINSKWVEIMESSFKCYQLGMYKMAIPNLLMVIEGEISELANSSLVGGKLLSQWKKDLDTESDQFDAIALYSLYLFLREVLFKTREFDKKRLEVINRNWILHGRDDPIHWKEEDYFRLINTLSSIQFVKEILENK